jgi:hypothetical protein
MPLVVQPRPVRQSIRIELFGGAETARAGRTWRFTRFAIRFSLFPRLTGERMVPLTPLIDVGLPQQILPEEEELILEGYVSVRGDVQLKQYRRRASDQAGVSITLMWSDDGRPLYARERIPSADLLND